MGVLVTSSLGDHHCTAGGPSKVMHSHALSQLGTFFGEIIGYAFRLGCTD